MSTLNDVLAVILGGGVGKRLYPLTRMRAKPAVPIAGKYRLIDVPISNCINSGINHIAVLTQFNSASLHRHITHTYAFDDFHNGWVQILAAEQTPRSTDWYQGTADAVRKQLTEIKASHTEYVLILAGDHLYRMDYASMAEFHWKNQADITVAVTPIAAQEAARFGLLKRNPAQRILSFVEKPRDPDVLAQFVSRDEPERPYLGSMGIYFFKTDVLVDLLESSSFEDFGGQIIPNAIGSHRVMGFDFDGYWEDIGTIRSFYETNLSLALPDPPFNFYDPVRPIYTRPRYLPGSVIDGATLKNVLLADGCQIRSSVINDSIVDCAAGLPRACAWTGPSLWAQTIMLRPGRLAFPWVLAPTVRSKAPSLIKTSALVRGWSSALTRAAQTWKKAIALYRMASLSFLRIPFCSPAPISVPSR